MKKLNLQKISLKSLLENNKIVIAISLILAVVFWCSTAIKVSPIETKTLSDIKVQFDLTVPSQTALLPFSDINNLSVNVTIQGKKSKLNAATKDILVAKVDCSDVNTSGTYTLPISVSVADQYANDFQITKVSQTNTRVWFDTLSEGKANITLDIAGKDKVLEGYVVGEPALSTDTVIYSGPTQAFNQVKKIIGKATLPDGAKEAVTVEPALVALDENGNEVNNITFSYEGQSKLSLVIPILKKATLPVGVTFLNAPPELTPNQLAITYSPNTLAIAASESYLKSATTLSIGSIDFTKLQPGIVNQIDFSLDSLNLKDVTVTDASVKKITITIDLTGYTMLKTYSVKQGNIQLTNVPDGYTATLVNLTMDNIGVMMPKGTIVESAELYAVVDLSNAPTDHNSYTKEFSAKVTLKNHNDCWVIGSYTTNIMLTRN